MSVAVDVDNFCRAQSDRMLAAVLKDAGAINAWMYNREPTQLDHQPVIRENRDTLYSGTVVDISRGATLSIPDAGGRYLSVMPINQNGYVNAVYYDAGDYELTVDQFETDYVLLPVRVLVNPSDPDDVAAANALQDQISITAVSARPFQPPAYDQQSLGETRDHLLGLAKTMTGFEHAFGSRDQVDPVRHLLGCAAAWGGLPDTEAQYLNVNPELPTGHYQLTVRDVPVDGFWSISLYDRQGYFPTDTGGRVNVNDLTADRNSDGSLTINFGGDPGLPNQLPIMDGWNYMVRLYRPHPEILDGTWTFPTVKPAN